MVIYMDMQTGREIREAGDADEVISSGRQSDAPIVQPHAALQLEEISFVRDACRMPPPRDIDAFLSAMADANRHH